MKRVGILTFHRANNFGAVLQNYALQQAIIMIGMEPETIDYYSQHIEQVYKIWDLATQEVSLVRIIKKVTITILNFCNMIISRKKFEDFREKYLKISSEKYDVNTISTAAYDVYITGSDQVWNKEIIGKEDIPIYTLAFAKEHTAAYGASCGGGEYLIDDIDNISKIKLITVREQLLCNNLKKMGISSRVVCDPVFLLKRAHWEKLIDKMPPKKHKYVLLYYIDEGREQAAMIAKELAVFLTAKVHYPRKYDKMAIMNHYGINKFSDGPLDFLNEIYQAEYVVCSSFHGIAFALLMRKEFTAVLHTKTGDRVKNLLEKLELEERIVSDKEDFQKRSPYWKPIDYNMVEKKLNEFREESMNYLREICRL